MGRAGARVALVLVLAAVALLAMYATAAGRQAASGHGAATSETVLTLRTIGDHDTLWLVSNEGTATAAGELPGVAGYGAASPNGTYAAYLPTGGKPFIWIGHGPAGVKTIDLQPAGVKTVTDLTWTSETQLLISGSTKAGNAAGYTDKLYTVDAASGAVASFRSLSGTEPSASPDTGKIVYVKYKKLKPNPKYPKIGHYRESLMVTSLAGSGAGTELDEDEYYLTSDYRAFAAPQLAPGGAWIAYGTTGSDVSVAYSVICLDSDGYVPWMKMWMPTPLAISWAPSSPLVALGGAAVGPGDQDAGIYVMDAPGGAVGRTTRDLFTKASIEWVMDMDWSLDGKLVVDGLPKDFDTSDTTQVLLIDGNDLGKLTDLGEGHLSLWVR
jgi:hypothetical protein